MKEHLNRYAIAHPSDVFDPDAIRILTGAFDNAWQRLQNSGIHFDSDRQSEQARNILAIYIIEQARQGERDERHLREGALLQYARSNLRNPPHK
jgi:hypothetical protein